MIPDAQLTVPVPLGGVVVGRTAEADFALRRLAASVNLLVAQAPGQGWKDFELRPVRIDGGVDAEFAEVVEAILGILDTTSIVPPTLERGDEWSTAKNANELVAYFATAAGVAPAPELIPPSPRFPVAWPTAAPKPAAAPRRGGIGKALLSVVGIGALCGVVGGALGRR